MVPLSTSRTVWEMVRQKCHRQICEPLGTSQIARLRGTYLAESLRLVGRPSTGQANSSRVLWCRLCVLVLVTRTVKPVDTYTPNSKHVATY